MDLEAIEKAFRNFNENKVRNYNFSFLSSFVFGDKRTRNCAVLTLELLEAGGLFKQIDFRPYGWKTVSTLGIVSGYLWSDFFNASYRYLYYFYNGVWKKGSLGIADIFFSVFGYKYAVLSYIVPNAVVKGMMAGLTVRNYSLLTTIRPEPPAHVRTKIAKEDAMKAGVICVAEWLLSNGVHSLLRNYGYLQPFYKRWPIFPSEFISIFNTKITVKAFEFLSKFIGPGVGIPIMLATPIVFVGFNLVYKYLYDTTITPKQVLDMADFAAAKQTEATNKKNKDTPNKTNSRYLFFFHNKTPNNDSENSEEKQSYLKSFCNII